MRWLTFAVVLAGCAWAVMQGVRLVRFDRAAEIAQGDGREAGALAAWTQTPGISSAALAALLSAAAEKTGRDEWRGRADVLTRLLAIRPGASQAWLSLASARNALGRPPEEVDAAFMMSGLTGPAEGPLMLERSVLGILIWERSSSASHARTATDLCGLTVFDPGRLRLVMTTKTDAIRAEIRTGLEAAACSPRTVAMVGL